MDFNKILSDLKNKNYYPVYLLEGEEPYFIDIVRAAEKAVEGASDLTMAAAPKTAEIAPEVIESVQAVASVGSPWLQITLWFVIAILFILSVYFLVRRFRKK